MRVHTAVATPLVLPVPRPSSQRQARRTLSANHLGSGLLSEALRLLLSPPSPAHPGEGRELHAEGNGLWLTLGPPRGTWSPDELPAPSFPNQDLSPPRGPGGPRRPLAGRCQAAPTARGDSWAAAGRPRKALLGAGISDLMFFCLSFCVQGSHTVNHVGGMRSPRAAGNGPT